MKINSFLQKFEISTDAPMKYLEQFSQKLFIICSYAINYACHICLMLPLDRALNFPSFSCVSVAIPLSRGSQWPNFSLSVYLHFLMKGCFYFWMNQKTIKRKFPTQKILLTSSSSVYRLDVVRLDDYLCMLNFMKQ